MRELGLINSLFGVALGMTTGAIPFMLWVMKGFIDTVPLELEEAAFLDGATRWQALTRVVLPLTLPGLGAAAILAFNGAWGSLFPAPDSAISMQTSFSCHWGCSGR